MQAIRAEDLSKTFRVKKKEKGMAGSFRAILHPQTEMVRAVDGVSFTVEDGEILGIDPAKKRKQLAYRIGTVFGQKEQLWTHLTPYDNFRFFGAVYDLSERETEERIKELAERFTLGGFLNVPVRNLSLGQRIRCEIAASLIHNPRILFLDEPTIGLDPVIKESVRELVRQMNRELNTTVFLTSHDVGDIEKLCRRVIVVNAGKIVLDDSMEKLKGHYLQGKGLTDADVPDVSLEEIIMEIYKSEGRTESP